MIPPLAHEIMYRRVPGLRAAVEHAVRDMRQHGWTESMIFDPPQLLDRSTIGEFLEWHTLSLAAAGWTSSSATTA